MCLGIIFVSGCYDNTEVHTSNLPQNSKGLSAATKTSQTACGGWQANFLLRRSRRKKKQVQSNLDHLHRYSRDNTYNKTYIRSSLSISENLILALPGLLIYGTSLFSELRCHIRRRYHFYPSGMHVTLTRNCSTIRVLYIAWIIYILYYITVIGRVLPSKASVFIFLRNQIQRKKHKRKFRSPPSRARVIRPTSSYPSPFKTP